MMMSGTGKTQGGKQRTKGRSRNTCEEKGSIQSFFNGTAKVKKKTVVCPVCTMEVELIRINEHMDSSDCKIEVEKVNKSSGVKRSSTESFPAGTKDEKRIKRDSVFEKECIEECI